MKQKPGGGAMPMKHFSLVAPDFDEFIPMMN